MSDIKEEVIFATAGLDTDTDYRYMSKGDAPYFLNILVGEEGSNGVITNMKGNHLASYPLDKSQVYKVLGSYYDITTRKVYYWVFSLPSDWSSSGDYIYDNHLLEFDEDTETIVNVFTDEHNYFGLDPLYYVKDVDKIGDYLYFNPRQSEPKMIDVQRAKNSNAYEYYDETDTYVYGNIRKFRGGVFLAVGVVGMGETPSTNPELWDRIGDCYQEETDIMGFDSEFEYAFNVIRHVPVSRPVCAYDTDTTKSANNVRNRILKFSHRYKYFDNTYSKFGAYSDVTLPIDDERYNGEMLNDITKNNYIKVQIPLHSPALIKEIDIIFQETGYDWKRAKIVNRQDQSLLDDDTYVYSFYNTDSAYEVITDDLLEEVYDSVPRRAATQELINKNILTYAGCTEGFDNLEKHDIDVTLTPEIQELVATYADSLVLRDNVLDGDANEVYEDETTSPVTHYRIIDVSDALSWGLADGDYYQAVVNGNVGARLLELSDLTNVEVIIGAMADAITGSSIWTEEHPELGQLWIGSQEYTPYITQSKFTRPSLTVSAMSKYRGFKTGSWHPFCIFYYDEAMRRCDAQTSKDSVDSTGLTMDGTSVYVPMLGEVSPALDDTGYKWNITWTVNHRPPDYAKWWRWGYAGNSLCSWFVQYTVSGIADDADHPWSWLDITPLQTLQNPAEAGWNKFPNSNISPYVFTKGDRVRLITLASADNDMGAVAEGIYDFEILEQDDENNKISIQQFDHGAAGFGEDTLIEIYRPHNAEDDIVKVFYEFGEMMPIIEDSVGEKVHAGITQNQDTDTLQAAVGTFTSGDVFHIIRTPSKYINALTITDGYFHESMWYSDFYNSANWDKGRIGVETSFNERTLNVVRYSNQYLQDTEINGLSTFEGDHYKSVTDIYGDIKSIIEVGNTLKVYMQKKSASILIGRQEYVDDNGQITVASSAAVLGSIRYPENNYGTEWIESVQKNNKYVYGFDIYNAIVWRDSVNGLFPISGRYQDAVGNQGDYKMSSWFKEKADALMLSGVENTMVITTWDEKYKMLFINFQDKSDNRNNATVVYHEPSNRWICFTEFDQTPEEGYTEILELDYSIVQGFEGGIGYHFDEDIRFAYFDIGEGLGTSGMASVTASLLNLTIEALTPLVSIITMPTVITNEVTDADEDSASGGGNVTSGGYSSITARGVCWSTSHNPTIADDHTSDGIGTGAFTSDLTGLTIGTVYYVRAYATNAVGTSYGNEVTFSTAHYITLTESEFIFDNDRLVSLEESSVVATDITASTHPSGWFIDPSSIPWWVDVWVEDDGGDTVTAPLYTGYTIKANVNRSNYGAERTGTLILKDGDGNTLNSLTITQEGGAVQVAVQAAYGWTLDDLGYLYGGNTYYPGNTAKIYFKPTGGTIVNGQQLWWTVYIDGVYTYASLINEYITVTDISTVTSDTINVGTTTPLDGQTVVIRLHTTQQ